MSTSTPKAIAIVTIVLASFLAASGGSADSTSGGVPARPALTPPERDVNGASPARPAPRYSWHRRTGPEGIRSAREHPRSERGLAPVPVLRDETDQQG